MKRLAGKHYKMLKKMLLDDAVIAPVFQRGLSYLQKPYVKDLYVHQFGPATSLKWADVQK